MKPSWDKAPSWARWMGQDQNGSWWWYEFKPCWMETAYVNQVENTGSRFKRATAPPRKRKGELEKRP